MKKRSASKHTTRKATQNTKTPKAKARSTAKTTAKKKPLADPQKQPGVYMADREKELLFIQEAISVELKLLRQARGLSLAEVAAQIGVTRGRIAHIERGTSDLHISTILRLVFYVYEESPWDFFLAVWRANFSKESLAMLGESQSVNSDASIVKLRDWDQ